MRKTAFFGLALLLACAPAAFGQGQDPGASQTAAAFTLGPEDQVQIWVYQEPDISATVTVRPDGRISLPLIGSVAAAGSTPESLEVELTELYRNRGLREPIVVVMVEQINSRNVNIFGEVNTPGQYPLLQPMTILDIIAVAGGFTYDANQGNVMVTSASGTSTRVDVKKILEGEAAIIQVQPGDTVYVK